MFNVHVDLSMDHEPSETEIDTLLELLHEHAPVWGQTGPGLLYAQINLSGSSSLRHAANTATNVIQDAADQAGLTIELVGMEVLREDQFTNKHGSYD